MTDPISHFGRMAQMDTSVRQSAKPEKRPAADQGQASQSAGSSSRLRDDAVQLSDVARQAMQESGFDRAKVDAIKAAIQRGQYPLDVRRIAESFVALEKMIKG